MLVHLSVIHCLMSFRRSRGLNVVTVDREGHLNAVSRLRVIVYGGFMLSVCGVHEKGR